jgi:uncharacterized protein YndB with AHSA1/START domain
MNSTLVGDSIQKEITIHAPAERVFAALVDPAERVQWWGAPGKFQATHLESDLRPGGAWLMRGTGAGGLPFTLRGEYRVVDRPRALAFTWKPDWDEPESLVRFELEERDGTTLVRLTHSELAEAARERYQGWPWLLSSLRAFVARPAP